MGEDQVRRTRRAQALVVVVMVAAWTAVLLIRRSLTAGDALSSILGGYVGLISVAVGAVTAYHWAFPPPADLDLGERADDLAGTLQQQWELEKQRRKLDSPHLLPLVWKSHTVITLPAEPVTVPPAGRQGRQAAPARTGAGAPDPAPPSPPPHSGDGRLAGDFDTAVGNLAGYFRGVPNRRLVVLGEPGSGKSVLSILLTIGLLASRSPGGEVPVQLNVSSWDPLSEALDSWIITSIARSHYDNRRRIPAQLWDGGKLLPILDGLDEIPESARRKAVAAINKVRTSGSSIVLTCRSVEYDDVIAGGSPELHGGSVITIQPVLVADLVTYLGGVSWPDDVDWDPVFEHIDGYPHRPAAAALSTPLMVSLVRRNYERLGGRPADLVDENALPSRHAVEDHVLSQVVTACYAPDRLVSGLAVTPAPRWRADRAQRWLTYLAKHLHAQHERDLAWWQLSDRLLSRWVTPVVGLLLGAFVLTLVTLGVLGFGQLTRQQPSFDGALAAGAGVGAVFWILAMLVLFAIPGQDPGQLLLARRGSLTRFRGGFLAGAGVAGFPTALVLITWAAGITLSETDWTFAVVHSYLLGTAAGTGVILVVAVALGVHTWLQAPPERSAEATAQTFLTRDRWSSVSGAFYAGLTAALGLIPGVLIAMYVVQVATSWPGNPGGGGFLTGKELADEARSDGGWWVLGGMMLLIWAVVALLLLLVRAWPRFVVVRVHHALTGRLPLRLMGFLNDAHERGVLRESAGRFQFAHIRLQEHLADTRPVSGLQRLEREDAHRRRRQQVAVVSIVLALVLATVVVLLAPKDEALVTFGTVTHEDLVTVLAYDPVSDSLLAGYASGGVRRWQHPTAADPDERRTVLPDGCAREPVLTVVARPGLVAAACSGGALRVAVRQGAAWQSEPDRQVPARGSAPRADVRFLAADHSGRVLATLDGDGQLTVWTRGAAGPRRLTVPPRPDLRTLDPVARQRYAAGRDRTVTAGLALSPDGRYLAVKDMDITPVETGVETIGAVGVLLWDLHRRTGRAVHRPLPSRPEVRIGFSSDSAALTTCDRSGGRRLTLDPWDPRAAVPAGAADPGLPIEREPALTCPLDGSAPIAAWAENEDVVTWVPGSGPGRIWHGHTGAVEKLRFLSPPGDQRYLATSSDDGTIRIWDVTPPQP